MARGPYKFKQRDITRAHKGAEAAGKVVVKTEITPSGSILLWHANDNVEASALESWKAKHAKPS